MIVVATTFEFLAKGDNWGRWAMLPGNARYLGEALGAVALLLVIVAGTRNRFQYVRPAYWILFGAIVFTMVAGVLVNQVEAGPIFAGLRTYLRALPWFFVGAVYAFTEPQIEKQLRLFTVLAIVQVPLAIEQRAHTWSSRVDINYSGDFTTGTLINSPVLSIFMICCICVLVAMFVRKKLSVTKFLVFFLLFLVPTMVNETKGTLFLLPFGLIVTYLAAAKPGRRIRAVMIAIGLIFFSGAIFVPVYDSFRRESQPGIMDFLSDPDETERYLYRDVEIGSDSERPAGRIDSIVVPLRRLSSDASHLVFGYGIGNVSDSALGAKFVGRHNEAFKLFMVHAFAKLILELGILGLLLILCIKLFIVRDAFVVARRASDLFGALAAGLAGITAVVAFSMIYTDLMGHISISFLFWYLAGLVSAHRMRRSAPSEKS